MPGPRDNGTTTIDLEEIFQNYAWTQYLKMMGKAKRLFAKRAKYNFNIQVEFLDFRHTTSTVPINAEDELIQSINFGTPQNSRRMSWRKKRRQRQVGKYSYKNIAMDIGGPSVLWSKEFDNTTDRTQQYPFHSDNISSSVTVEFSQNYSLGDRTNIELSLADVKVQSVSWTKDPLILTNAKKQEFDGVFGLDFCTDIPVQAGHRVHAILWAHEQPMSTAFEVETEMSLSIGCLPIVIRRKADDKIVFTCFISNLNDVFDRHQGPNLTLSETIDGSCYVVMTSRGRCRFSGWTDKEVVIKTSEIQQ